MSDQESDKDLFRQALDGVRPLKSKKVAPTLEKPKPEAKFARYDEDSVIGESMSVSPDELELEFGEELSYSREGIPGSVLRKLRRGGYTVQSEIDLHGLTVAEAKQALFEFLGECIARKILCIRVVHGKGNRSGHRGPVLKGKVNIWLRRRSDIVAFVSAPRNDGGTGAVYVLLG